MKLALFGGVYSNAYALESALADARARGVDGLFCLGDIGAFGPDPDRVYPLLRGAGVRCLQGNYDHSLAAGLADCQCGYTDPRDNHFARLSYAYTSGHTSAGNKAWLAGLPPLIRLREEGLSLLLCHGSPRRTNEFLWESTTPDGFLERLMDEQGADVIAATHTGLKWQRRLPSGRLFVNVGVLGRPENDGRPNTWYALLHLEGGRARAEFVPVRYDTAALARDMLREGLPEEFVQTALTGWWTSCLEVLPHKERARGRF